eukprot:m.230112 g.230112  ORF g.230112 m.230112 type:complete len:107 (-) comp17918_c0_seq1:68-388(-)
MASYKPLLNSAMLKDPTMKGQAVTLFGEVLENTTYLRVKSSDGGEVIVALESPQPDLTRYISVVGVVQEDATLHAWVIASVGDTMDLEAHNELVVLMNRFPGICHA